jgi:hypothetical protein
VAAFFSNIMGNSELLHKACKTAVEASSSFQAIGLTMYPPVPLSVEQELDHVPIAPSNERLPPGTNECTKRNT